MARRPTDLVFLCLAALLVLTPLVLNKPGWPAGLKSDEPAYYLMALSLAKDGDLLCEVEDIRRLFAEFPYHVVHNLILATDDGWNTVYFGKPFVYSLFAAPAAGLFGASGLVAFNMALMLFMVWLGARYLERFNLPWLALLFSFGFFFLSCGFSYIFWIHPEIFNMTAVMVSLYLGLTDSKGRRGSFWSRPGVRAAASGAALMLAVYNKPMMLAFCLPALFRGWTQQRWRGILAWGLGAFVSGLVVVGFAMALMGHPSAYLMARGGQKVCEDDRLPIQPVAPPVVADVEDTTPGDTRPIEGGRAPNADETSAVDEEKPKRPKASWYWLLRIPRPHPSAVLENLRYFFVGRHTGLLLYFPFALLAVGLFLAHRRRHLDLWVNLLAIATIAIYFLLWIPINSQAGGGFVGNRYFVNAYPAFLFLVGPIAPAATALVGFLLGGLLLGPTLFSPFGRAVPSPTLQAHVRNFPFPHFPLELSLKEVPGYEQRVWAGALIRGRSDVFLPKGPRFWTHGATTTEIWIQSTEKQESLFFEVGSLMAPNTVTLRLEDAEAVHEFRPGPDGKPQPPRTRLELRPSGPSQVRRVQDAWVYVYRVEVEASHGLPQTWDRRFPPQDCFRFAYNETIQDNFFVGTQMAYLGSKARFERDLYDLEWGEVDVPSQARTDEVLTLTTRLTNRSQFPWPIDLPTRVALSYRWTTPDGKVVVDNGLRTYPPKPVEPGALLEIAQEVAAPTTPGTYVLELDLVYEMVAWFSWRNDGDVYRTTVEVEDSEETPTLEAP